MSEQFGCDTEHVWLTIAVAMLPLILSIFFEPPVKFFCWSFVIIGYLLIFTPFNVLLTEQGITIRSLTRTRLVSWSQVIGIKYSRRWRLITINSELGTDIIPFIVWLFDRKDEHYFALLEALSLRLPPDRIDIHT